MADLFHLSTVSVRPSSVFGPMDRLTPELATTAMSPTGLRQLALDGSRCVRVNTLDAIGDYVHVEDVARAINCAQWPRPACATVCYNIASGRTSQHSRHRQLGDGEKCLDSPPKSSGPNSPTCCRIRRCAMACGAPMNFAHLLRDLLAPACSARGHARAYMEWLVAERRANVAIAAGAAEWAHTGPQDPHE